VGNCLATAVVARWEGEFVPNIGAVEQVRVTSEKA
jgi:hypothetical protein